ncbi:MAG TPA: SDR family oxidoreductase [Streptosporangiaceae bacterium]|nr:SDR family oxidoreductase [Streptosporangiaceae bacterium]
MKLTVFGATGRIGSEVVRQAIAAGHEVVAVVRDPARLAVPAGPGLGVVTADVMDPAQIGPAVKGSDAVVSALGPRKGGPVTVLTDGMRSILTAMEDTGVRRLVAVSASGAFIEPSDPFVTRVIAKPLLQRFLRDAMADTRRMEGEVWASTADWTLVRPPQLTNRPGRGRYRRMIDRNVGRSIARADVADAILAVLADPATIGHVVGVGY